MAAKECGGPFAQHCLRKRACVEKGLGKVGSTQEEARSLSEASAHSCSRKVELRWRFRFVRVRVVVLNLLHIAFNLCLAASDISFSCFPGSA